MFIISLSSKSYLLEFLARCRAVVDVTQVDRVGGGVVGVVLTCSLTQRFIHLELQEPTNEVPAKVRTTIRHTWVISH